MSKLSRGKYAKAISDRSGMEFPYNEMVKEWNGSLVHVSEFEPKQPQLEPTRYTGDPQGLSNARPARTEPATQNMLPSDPFSITASDQTITVTEPNHGRAVSETVRFRNVNGSPGALAYTIFENASGFSITSIATNTYTFELGSTPTLSGNFGGNFVTAGPVTQQA